MVQNIIFLSLIFLILISIFEAANDSSYEIVPIEVNSVKAIKDAEFAVKELSLLSDSGIYSTIALSKIIAAAEQDGIYHFNTLLKLELSSPHFQSGNSNEIFSMIVMVNKEDNVKALAIDEFPVMDEDAIEEFYIKKIEEKRRRREEAFRRLEIEAYFAANKETSLNADVSNLKDHVDGKTIQDILSELDSEELRNRRIEESRKGVQIRLNGQYLIDEEELAKMSLRELFEIVTDQRSATDYQKYRAQTLLDVALRSL